MSNGIGRAKAERLAQDGTVVAGIVSKGGNAVAIQGDMSKVA